jgi:uncharacterized membrane protein
MTGRLSMLWHYLRGSLWLVPSVMVAGAVVLAAVMVQLSASVDQEALKEYPRFFGAGAESSRDMLAVIAAAMMTVAAVTFSITILAVSQASSQYTPRILRSFMKDRPSQLTLGTLTGVFVYCMVVIRTIRGDEELRFIPALAVLFAFVLAIFAIAMLVYFIHHVATSLDASSIISRVRDDTLAAIERLFPEELGEERTDGEQELPPESRWEPVAATRTGYVTAVDAEGLLDFAEERGVVLRMERGIGEHVIAGTPLASVARVTPAGEDADEPDGLHSHFHIASFRTVEQDAEFGFRQMVDVAVKAISPGINDTSTAVIAIDAIGAALVRLSSRHIENPLRTCNGRVLVVARGPTYEALVAVALDEIRRNGEGNVSVLGRLLSMLRIVARSTTSSARRSVLLDHARRILETAERSVADRTDLEQLRKTYGEIGGSR